MPDRPDFEVEGRDWPLREFSSFVETPNARWHVQRLGPRGAPVVVLLHGTGAATHSWRHVAPLLAERFDVVSADLPGHGFSDPQPLAALSIDGMATSVAQLLNTMQLAPHIIVGHSAGAVVAARMCIDGLAAPRGLVSINGALVPLRGLPRHVFSPVAKLMASTSIPARLVSMRVSARKVRRLIHDTGSTIDSRGVDLYERLVRCPSHVLAALGMMARWDLPAFQQDLPRLRTPLLLLSGTRDRTIAPRYAREVQQAVAGAELEYLPQLGHLAHEENARLVAGLVRSWAERLVDDARAEPAQRADESRPPAGGAEPAA